MIGSHYDIDGDRRPFQLTDEERNVVFHDLGEYAVAEEILEQNLAQLPSRLHFLLHPLKSAESRVERKDLQGRLQSVSRLGNMATATIYGEYNFQFYDSFRRLSDIESLQLDLTPRD